jgi:hypothetical protein
MTTTPNVSPLIVGPVGQGNSAVWGVTGSAGEVGILDGGPSNAYHADSGNTAHVLTAANLTGASSLVTLALTGALGAGANATTDTAANIIAAMPSPSVGTTHRLRIINESSGAFSWTVVGGTGVTVTGTATIAQNTWREFVVTVTNVGTPAVTLQNVGTGTYS